MSLRSFLSGNSRVYKKKSPSKRAAQRPGPSPAKGSGSRSGSGVTRLRQSDLSNAEDGDAVEQVAAVTTPVVTAGARPDAAQRPTHAPPPPRDIPAAIDYALATMFDDPLSSTTSGPYASTAVSATLRFRAALPAVVTAAHVSALLLGMLGDDGGGCGGGAAANLAAGRRWTPTAIERELAALMLVRRAPGDDGKDPSSVAVGGVLRRMVLPRSNSSSSSSGGLLVRAEEVERLVVQAVSRGQLDDATSDAYRRLLRDHPSATRVSPARYLTRSQVDRLVRAGFLLAPGVGGGSDGRSRRRESGPAVAGGSDGVSPLPPSTAAGYLSATTSVVADYSRPATGSDVTSVERAARAPSGSVWAVGGEGAVHEAGGSGGGGGGGGVEDDGEDELFVSLPGNGSFVRLVSAALVHFTDILGRMPFREASLSTLRERWDGGVARPETSLADAGKKSRGQFVGAAAGRTRRWREFHGLRFEWVLAEALGAGIVEMFDTGSVGRGVRLL